MIKAVCCLCIFLCGCSGLEKSEKEKIKKANLTYQPVLRRYDERSIPPFVLTPLARDLYPWEKESLGRFSSITKEHFRCKGNSLNPKLVLTVDQELPKEIRDCAGIDRHSLPIKDKKEFIYPILIELLNAIQKKLMAKVIITCGHRCPEHHAYSEQSREAKVSKHLIGAEVDFYVEGYENKPQEVLEMIRQYYLSEEKYQGLKEFQIFRTLSKTEIENQEISVKIRSKNEGRDFDNRHPYPYLTIEVKYDFDSKKKVEYSWKAAHLNLMQN